MMQGEMIKVRDEYWMIEATEGQYPNYRYLFPIDPFQEILESEVHHRMRVNFSVRYHKYELVAWLHDTDRGFSTEG
jgi:hypothetical protein